MLKRDVDIGSVIRKVFRERGMTVKQFADALGCHRTRIYPIFESRSIDTDLLVRISKILDYPFLLEYFEKDAPVMIYLVLTEVDKSKMVEMLDDPSLKIIKTWSSV